MVLCHIFMAAFLYWPFTFHQVFYSLFIVGRSVLHFALFLQNPASLSNSPTWKQSRGKHWRSWMYLNTLYSHFAGSPQPQVILASPVSQPWREAHSFTSIGPAARWIAPSTGEESTGGSETWPGYVKPTQTDYLQKCFKFDTFINVKT